MPEQAKQARSTRYRRPTRRRWRVAALALILFVTSWPSEGGVEGKARVVDGDTLEVAGERVRLHGVDAPELDQPCERNGASYPCGVAAARWLEERIGSDQVRCEEVERDRYGRLVAVCFAGTENLNEGLVVAGWALAYRRFSKRFLGDELDAIQARRGLWAGRFVVPWEWRRGEQVLVDAGSEAFQTTIESRLELAGDPGSGGAEVARLCPVKGNVNSSGRRVYHVPGGSHYDRLNLDPVEGDRCFATEADAEAAGFRAALR